MKPTDTRARDRFLTANSQGPRKEQQDAAVCLHSAEHGTALLVVGDGVGGKRGGRLASQKVVELAEQMWEERGGELADPAGELQTLCRVAHEHINSEGSKYGMAPRTTIVALYLNATQAHWVHSGDSRLYHFRGGQLLSRTGDHSLLELMVERGMVKEEDMGKHPDQGTLLQSLGGEEYVPPSAGMADITPKDGFILCTDGFWERTPVEEMAGLLFCAHAQAPGLAEQAVSRAVERNGAKGDNVTVALALPAQETVQAVGHSAKTGAMVLGAGGGALGLLLLALMTWTSDSATKEPTASNAAQETATGPAVKVAPAPKPAATPLPSIPPLVEDPIGPAPSTPMEKAPPPASRVPLPPDTPLPPESSRSPDEADAPLSDPNSKLKRPFKDFLKEKKKEREASSPTDSPADR